MLTSFLKFLPKFLDTLNKSELKSSIFVFRNNYSHQSKTYL